MPWRIEIYSLAKQLIHSLQLQFTHQIMLSALATTIRTYSSSESSFIREITEQNNRTQAFFKEIESWRNLQTLYTTRMTQIVNNLREQSFTIKAIHKDTKADTPEPQPEIKYTCANYELSRVMQIVLDNHKSFLSKINYDIFLVNHEMAGKLLEESQFLIEQERQNQKYTNSKKEQLQKVLIKKEKLKKQREEELILELFMKDAVDAPLDQKMRRKAKINDLQKEIDQYEIKVRETVDDYKKLHLNSQTTIAKLKTNEQELKRCKLQTLLKVELHFTIYCKNVMNQIDEARQTHDEKQFENIINSIFDRFEKQKEDVIKNLAVTKPGFMETSLRRISDNTMEELIQYSRDRDIKSRIKRMMETNEVNPEETDEMSRQVKLIKKMLAQEIIENDCLSIFRTIINKSSKLRMNFVFVLQFYRLNSQFEINLNQICPLHCLISELLLSCYDSRDSFVLKQLMILLMTYYVSHPQKDSPTQKIYIIHFFKKDPLWKDIEYWQSILVESIYMQKKNTIRMMLTNTNQIANLNRKKELLQAERSAILNQMLMVVRNMIIFEYSEKQVKTFANRFIKLLKQDERLQKDINNTIEDAVQEQKQLCEAQKQAIKEFYKCNLISSKKELNRIPINVRRSYIE